MGKFDGYMIGSDFDGTFSVHGVGVTGRNLEAVRYFRREGGVFGIVTGRCHIDAVDNVAASYKDDIDFVVTMNGSAAAFPDGRLIFENLGDVDALRPLYECINTVGEVCFIGCASTEEFFLLGDEDERTRPEDIPFFNQINVGCVSLAQAKELAQTVGRRFAGQFNPMRNVTTVDIPPAGVTKATGIRACAERFGVPEENIFTVGDNYNDIDMIRAFNGCAVANAVDDLKSAAKVTVPDVAGVVEYIEKTRVS